MAGVLLGLMGYSGQAQTDLPPVVTAVGDFVYCPLTTTPIVTSFNITDPDDTEIDAFFVQISVGYERNTDRLTLTGNHPNITTSWDAIQGKLTIRGPGGGPVQYTDLIPAIYDLEFESTSVTPQASKQFSLTIGSANYLPQTGHYYEFVPLVGITWNNARVAAENRTFFGLQGYLATITSVEEARLSGEQAAGTGWIGGSDAAQEGRWIWVTGPEAGTVFWNGGVSGSSPTFAFWNIAEPNNLPTGSGDEDYAHVTSPNIGVPGSWNDLPNEGASSGDYQPKGYMVEYGGLPGDPVLQLSASTNMVTPVVVSTQENSRCGDGSTVLEATVVYGDALWFDENDNLLFTGPSFTTPPLTQSTTYYVLASQNGCTNGIKVPVQATVNSLPIIDDNIVFRNCDEDGVSDGFTDFNLHEITPLVTLGDSNLTVSYHPSRLDAENNTGQLNELPYNNMAGGTIYARAWNNFGCALVSEITLDVSTTAFPPNFMATLEECDNDEQDGFYSFLLDAAIPDVLAQFPVGQNLTVAFYKNLDDAVLEQNAISGTTGYVNETAFTQVLYIRVENLDNGNCVGIGPYLQLQVLPLVDFDLLDTELILCDGSEVEAGVANQAGDYQYEWRDGDGTLIGYDAFVSIDAPGRYSVVAISEFGCLSPVQEVHVELSAAPVLTNELIAVEDAGSINTITVLDEGQNLGRGNYEYALDSPFGPYQDSPVFVDIEPGLHVLYASDKNGCGADQITVGVVGIPKFMTPNNDQTNDTLSILGLTPGDYSSASLVIMDRYGKLLAQMDAFESAWNGEYNGVPLPASDYWYILNLVDSEGKEHRRTGHFSLKR